MFKSSASQDLDHQQATLKILRDGNIQILQVQKGVSQAPAVRWDKQLTAAAIARLRPGRLTNTRDLKLVLRDSFSEFVKYRIRDHLQFEVSGRYELIKDLRWFKTLLREK